MAGRRQRIPVLDPGAVAEIGGHRLQPGDGVGLDAAVGGRKAVLELVGDVKGQRVLDPGCGPGLYADPNCIP